MYLFSLLFLLRDIGPFCLKIVIPIFLSLRVILIADFSYHQPFLLKLMFRDGLGTFLRRVVLADLGAM